MNKNIKALLWEAEHHRRTNWILSVEILEGIIKKAPKTLEAHEMLYSIFMHNSMFRKAEKIVNRALIHFPNNDHLYFLMGNIFLAQKGKSRLAIDWFQRVKQKFPELNFNLAVAFVYHNQRRDAVKIFEKILPYFSHLPTTFTFIAEQYIALQQYDKAINVLSTAEIKFPTHKEIFYLKAICYNKKMNWIQAYLYFEKSKAFGYDSAEFFNTIGECCKNIGDSEKAIKYYKRSIAQNIFFIKSYLDLSKLYISENDFLNARKYLSIARRIDPLNIFVALASERLKRIKKDKKRL